MWEQAKLNMNVGLYRVNRTEDTSRDKAERFRVEAGDVFQIRGFDLANMTLLYDGEAWIIMDALTVSQTAAKAWNLIVQKHLLDKPISAVIYSHSHVDHYGGVGGLKPYFRGDCEILAPEGFTEHAVSENVYAGTAMGRRSVYQYGNKLPVNTTGQIDSGIGKVTAKGEKSLIAPTEELTFGMYSDGKYIEKQIGKIAMRFQLTPGTEAPAEMNVYLPAQKLLFIAENCTATLHNALTPRGAQVRDLLAWANYLDQTLVSFPGVEVVCCAHTWPHFGAADCTRFIELQRDMYRYIHNATLHLINQGYTIDEVGRMLGEADGCPLPRDYADAWCCHGFYGTINHNAKAVYQRYIGWYDGNPAHLNQHTPVDRATRYIQAFGAEKIKAAATPALMSGDYPWAAELLHNIMYADRTIAPIEDSVFLMAQAMYANALQQMGYQSEAATWRNMYLTAALEVEEIGSPRPQPTYLGFGDDMIQAMSLEMILQYMGIQLDNRRVEQTRYTCEINVTVSNKNGEYEHAIAKVGRGILHYRIVSSTEQYDNAEIDIKSAKLEFFRAFVDHDENALRRIFSEEANRLKAEEFIGYLTRFDVNFPIMTPRRL